MNIKKIKKYSINSNSTIKSALIKIKKCGTHCLLVTDKTKLLGTCTDGDIRKKLILGYSINKKINKIFNNKPIYFKRNSYSIFDVDRVFKKQIELLPIVDDNKNVIDLYIKNNFDLSKNSKNKIKKKNPVIIMAGGLGKRMKPFTKVLPKPLIPVQDKPVISHIIETFSSLNFNKFFVSINKKDQIIRNYLEEKFKNKKIKFLEETKPLGTLGSLKLLKNKFKNDFFVSVTDTIVKMDFDKLIKFHIKKSALCTIVASKQTINSNYGNCIIDESSKLIKIEEKPKIKFLSNVGLYFFSKKIFNYLPKQRKFSILDIVKILNKENLKVFIYEIDNNNWQDVGNWKDFQKTIDIFDKTKIISN